MLQSRLPVGLGIWTLPLRHLYDQRGHSTSLVCPFYSLLLAPSRRLILIVALLPVLENHYYPLFGCARFRSLEISP